MSRAAAAAQGHVGRARRLAQDSQAQARRQAVLDVPRRLTGVGACFDAAAALIAATEAESAANVSDVDAKVSDSYGSVMERGGNKLSARNTFIIDPKGKIAKVFTAVKPPEHSAEVLQALAELQKK